MNAILISHMRNFSRFIPWWGEDGRKRNSPETENVTWHHLKWAYPRLFDEGNKKRHDFHCLNLTAAFAVHFVREFSLLSHNFFYSLLMRHKIYIMTKCFTLDDDNVVCIREDLCVKLKNCYHHTLFFRFRKWITKFAHGESFHAANIISSTFRLWWR